MQLSYFLSSDTKRVESLLVLAENMGRSSQPSTALTTWLRTANSPIALPSEGQPSTTFAGAFQKQMTS